MGGAPRLNPANTRARLKRPQEYCEARPQTVGYPSATPDLDPLTPVKQESPGDKLDFIKRKLCEMGGSRVVVARPEGQHHAPAHAVDRMVIPRPEWQHQAPLIVHDLQTGPGIFDPRQPQVQSQIVAQLGLHGAITIVPVGGFTGGRNEGVWILTDRQGVKSEQYVLKLISCHRCHHTVPTETENFLKLSRDHPGLSGDREMTFPVKLFACQNRPRRYDLVVMRSAPGMRLAEVLHAKWAGRQVQDIMKILGCVGQALKRFHMRYGNTQHQDFQPANVFWDDATDAVTIIDLGGMGLATTESDNDYFKKALRMMTERWGAMREDACRAFDAGYSEQR